MSGRLRPLERRVLQLREEGVMIEEIGRRFRRSPDHIRRVIDLTKLEGRSGEPARDELLRPLERRVLHLREQGTEYAEIGRRFKRSADHIRRVEGLARYKQALDLLGT